MVELTILVCKKSSHNRAYFLATLAALNCIQSSILYRRCQGIEFNVAVTLVGNLSYRVNGEGLKKNADVIKMK